jgi:predicted metalloprotease
VALTGYERDLQHRLEIGARRRQALVERPKALEVESAGGMIARFEAIEQLAAGSMAA